MAVDPRELHSAAKPKAVSRPCAHCGYDLTGLDAAGRCPECGAAIQAARSRGRYVDNLADAPPRYLRNLARAVLALALLAIALPFCYVFAFRAVNPQAPGIGPPLWRDPAFPAFALVLSALWLFIVWFVTAPRDKAEHTLPDATLDSRRFRLTNRVLQAGWPLASALLLAVAPLSPGRLDDSLQLLSILALLAAFIGLGPLAYHLRALAAWAGEDRLAARYLAAAWGLAVCASLGLVLSAYNAVFAGNQGLLGILAGFASLFGALANGLAVIGHILFLICNIQLASTIRWALVNHRAAAERDARVAERKAREEADRARAHAGHAQDPRDRDDPFARLPSANDRPTTQAKDTSPIPLVNDDDRP